MNSRSWTKNRIHINSFMHIQASPRFHAATKCNDECFTIENYKRNVNQNIKNESVS